MGFLERCVQNRLKRRKTQIHFVGFLHSIAGRLVNLEPDEYEDFLYGLLRGVGEFTGARTASLVSLSADREKAADVREWYPESRELVKRKGGDFPVLLFPPWKEELALCRAVSVESLEFLPGAARDILAARKTESLLAVPILRQNVLEGFLNFESPFPHRWTEYEVESLKLTAHDIVNLQLRWEDEKDIREARNHFIQIVTAIESVFFLFSRDLARAIYVSPAYAKIWERSVESLKENPLSWLELLYGDERVWVEEAFLQFARSEEVFSLEFRLKVPSGAVKWVSFRAFKGKDGDNVRIVAMADDITQKKNAEMQIVSMREADLETSARIQRTILVEELKIEIEGIDIASLSIPSQDVDGDFYTALTISPDAFDLLIGDVMGKGLPGAFIAAAVRNQFLRVKLEQALRSAGAGVAEPADIVNEVSGRISQELIHLESFVTLSYARFNLRSLCLNFVDCGHTPIIHFHRESERCWLVKGRNLPLGFSEEEVYTQSSLPFEESDILFFYSDGISEARNQAGEFYGEHRIVAVIEENYAKSAQEIINAVKGSVLHFSEGNFLADDFTCVCVKMNALPCTAARRHGIFPGDMKVLSNVREFITECLAEDAFAAISREEKEGIIIAGNEAASNVIDHGLDPNGESSFYMEIGVVSDWLFLRFIYAGKPFPWTAQRSPQVESLQERGYGIFIMEQLMDSVNYATDSRGGIMMTMMKKFEKKSEKI